MSLKGFFRWYICSLLYYIGTEVSLKGILGGMDVDVIPEQYSTDQSPPGLLGTYKRLDGIKGCEYRTSAWHWVSSIYCTNLNRHVGT